MIHASVKESPFDVVSHASGSEIRFASLPFWQGVQKRPGVHVAYPFALSVERGRLIRQSSDAATISTVVEGYGSDEYGFMTDPPGVSDWANELGDVMVATVVRGMGARTPRHVLEIGAGSDYVARKLKERYPIESYVIVDPAVRGSMEGLEVIREYFPHPKLGDRRFDLILAFNCLEHVPDPAAFLGAIRERLTQDGLVVLVYPDCEAQLRTGDLNVLIHEHLSYFTEASTRTILAEGGFGIESLHSSNDTFAVTASPIGKKQIASPPMDETSLLLDAARGFELVLRGKADAIRGRLQAGETVGFHGATNALNIFMHLTGLGTHPGIRVYDGDSSKHGSFLPAASQPILSPMDSSYSKNATLVVSAMSYFEAISKFARERHGFSSSRLWTLRAS